MQAGPGVLSESDFGIYHGKQLVAELSLEEKTKEPGETSKTELSLTNKVASQKLLIFDSFNTSCESE